LIFKNKEYYFETEKELREIYEKLRDPAVRNRWIEEQRTELRYILDNMMDPMFSFSDYCEEKEFSSTKSDIKTTEPLF
jgi:hypothetical protein